MSAAASTKALTRLRLSPTERAGLARAMLRLEAIRRETARQLVGPVWLDDDPEADETTRGN